MEYKTGLYLILVLGFLVKAIYEYFKMRKVSGSPNYYGNLDVFIGTDYASQTYPKFTHCRKDTNTDDDTHIYALYHQGYNFKRRWGYFSKSRPSKSEPVFVGNISTTTGDDNYRLTLMLCIDKHTHYIELDIPKEHVRIEEGQPPRTEEEIIYNPQSQL